MDTEHASFRTDLVANLLTSHAGAIRLEGDESDETKLWHLLLSIIEYCDAQQPRIDLNALLGEVRQALIEMQPMKP